MNRPRKRGSSSQKGISSRLEQTTENVRTLKEGKENQKGGVRTRRTVSDSAKMLMELKISRKNPRKEDGEGRGCPDLMGDEGY